MPTKVNPVLWPPFKRSSTTITQRTSGDTINSTGNLTFATGLYIASGATNTNTLTINANDTAFITLTTGATDTCTIAGATITGALTQTSTDGGALGSGTVMWSDLFLANEGVINWNNGNATLTHSAGLLTSNVDINLASGETYNINSTSVVKFHGIEAAGALSFSDADHILTIAAGTNTYWYKGLRYTTANAITCDIDSYETLTANTTYFFYFDAAAGLLKCSDSPWTFYDYVPVASVFWNGTNGAIQSEKHDYRRDLAWHEWAHDTIGTRYESGLDKTYPSVATDASLQIESGGIQDEDLHTTIGQQTTMRGLYKASANVYTWANYSLPYLGAAGDPYWLDTDDYTLKSVADNKYVCYWVYATNDTSRPIWVIPTHAADPYDTIAQARLEAIPSLGSLNLNPEMKLIYRFIYQGDGQFQESNDYRLSSPLPSGNSANTTATAVSFAASGNIASTTVQSAIEELDTEKLALAGGSMTGDIVFGSGYGIRSGASNGNTLIIGSNDTTFITITSDATDTCVLASSVTGTTQAPADNSTKLATTAYVDTAIGTVNSLSEVLALGNTTGATDIVVSSAQGISTALVDDNYFLIKAVDNDPNTASEVARVQGAADPYFSAGGSQQFKFYNSGIASFAGTATGDAFIDISPTLTGNASTNTYAVNISPVGITIPTGTTAIAASLYVAEPIFTETGTLTLATNVYIDAAPTEGGTNYSLYVVGTSYLTGAITAPGGITGTLTGDCTGNAGTVTNGVYTTDTGTVTAKMLQAAAADLGDADINIDLSNSNTGNVTNLTIDGTFQALSLGVTGTRIANAFFTDLAVTNTITGNVSGTAATVTGATQASITTCANLTTVGTIGTGIWQGTTIKANYLQQAAADLGDADITVDLSNSNAGNVTNLTIDGVFTPGTSILLSAGTGIEFTTPTTDAQCTGNYIDTIAAGYSSAVGDLVFLGSGGKWLEVDADAIATCQGLFGIALEAKTDTQAMKVALPGSIVHIDAWNMTVGATQYAGETLGAIQEAIPTGADGVIRIVGFAIDADTLAFFPSSDHQTVVA